MAGRAFKAMVVRRAADGRYARDITRRETDDLPDGELLVRVNYSSMNYKDALSATGNRGVTRRYPHTPGIDAAGVVAESASPRFSPGDEVIVSGYDLGMNTPGGFGQYIRVPAGWTMTRPEGITLRDSMVYGTAGFAAALCALKLERAAITPDRGEVLVTGATGGVGSFAIGILSRMGYRVVAATGKTGEAEFLIRLGAREVIPRQAADDASKRPLSGERWAAVVDTVGGDILATAIKSTGRDGIVICVGLVASPEVSTTVYPFILRGVSLCGIDSAQCPMDIRMAVWERIALEWKLDALDDMAFECTLEGLSERIDAMVQGRMKGRVVVNLGQ